MSTEALRERDFVQGSTSEEVFYRFINRGEERACHRLPEDLEHYLVRLLMVSVRDTSEPQRLAMILFDAEQASSVIERGNTYHDLGFEAVKLLGFFPGNIARRRVSTEYVRQMARIGYAMVSHIDRERVPKSAPLRTFIPLSEQILGHLDEMIKVIWYARDDYPSILAHSDSVGV